MRPSTSLIVSTFNRPQALEICFHSIADQTVMPVEIVVADDGSGESTRMVIEKYTKILRIPVIHVWQEDKGFRLAKIRNRAILKSESEYLIFIDGDVILDRNFISDHICFSRKGCFLTGSRVLIGAGLTGKILTDMKFRPGILNVDLRNRMNCIRSRMFAGFFSGTNNSYLNVRGCNMSFWKSDLLEVNGFNQEFEGWGREDSEIVVRLMHAGKKRTRLKFAGIQYHLHHKESSREKLDENDKILEKTVNEKIIIAPDGIGSLKKNH